MSGSDLRVHFADRSFLYAVIKIGRQYRLHIFRGAFVKYEADLRKAPALSVDQTVQPDGSGINQLLNDVQAQPHQGVPHALMRQEQFAKRSDERRVGTECARTGRYRWSTNTYK